LPHTPQASNTKGTNGKHVRQPSGDFHHLASRRFLARAYAVRLGADYARLGSNCCVLVPHSSSSRVSTHTQDSRSVTTAILSASSRALNHAHSSPALDPSHCLRLVSLQDLLPPSVLGNCGRIFKVSWIHPLQVPNSEAPNPAKPLLLGTIHACIIELQCLDVVPTLQRFSLIATCHTSSSKLLILFFVK
jgi:hypothetical protein